MAETKKPGFATAFYQSRTWKRCARAYRESKFNLCERCYAKGYVKPGEEVHHKIKLTPENIKNPDVSLNWSNLELLCKDCHLEEHTKKRWRADRNGKVEL